MRILLAAKRRSDIATKWRKVTAIGRKPMEHREHNAKSRRDERNTGIRFPFRPFGPSGLPRCSCYRIHGLAPMATSFRPFGTRNHLPRSGAPFCLQRSRTMLSTLQFFGMP